MGNKNSSNCIRARKNVIDAIIYNYLDPTVVVDKNGIIIMLNKPYADFLGIEPEEALGKHCTEIIENSRMHIVAETGVSEIGDIQRIKGHNMVCKRIPVREDGVIIGAVGIMMFKDLKDLKVLSNKLNQLEQQLEYYKGQLEKKGGKYTFADIIGDSKHINELKEKARLVAGTNSPVLIRGESGTGKEMFAQSIHNYCVRCTGPFIKVNCAAIPEQLLESELFGYEEGAFTGAKKGGKMGKFELADKGTIFLDEIGDMSLNMQIKLLRVLQEKEIERVGGTKCIPIDVRVIAATNRPLEKLIKEEKFRMDLYYRLNVVELKILPLRERKEDIPKLIEHFLIKISSELDRPKPKISRDTVEVLMEHDWPGNIRELANVLERSIIFADKGVIDLEHLAIKSKIKIPDIEHFGKQFTLKNSLLEVEKKVIQKALLHTNGNRVAAAQVLGISRSQLYKKMEKFALS